LQSKLVEVETQQNKQNSVFLLSCDITGKLVFSKITKNFLFYKREQTILLEEQENYIFCFKILSQMEMLEYFPGSTLVILVLTFYCIKVINLNVQTMESEELCNFSLPKVS
jgi:hypothetical protein